MSGHEKAKHTRNLRPGGSGVGNGGASTTSTTSSKSPIAQPPRAALSGRSKTDHDDTASIKSTSTSGKDGDRDINIPISSPASAGAEEKERRISELEREISTMTTEFESELSNLSHKLASENETANYWQQKYSALNQTYVKTEGELRALRLEVGSFQLGREERERDVKTRVSSLMLDRDAFREAYNEAMGELRAKEDLVGMLQSQVMGLKSFVSTSSKMDEQVSDEAFGERMQRLGNGLQNWVITNFRKVKIDPNCADETVREELQKLVPTYEALASSSKIHLVQSLLSRLLVEHIFSTYFVGLPAAAANTLHQAASFLAKFGSVESMNQWRSATLAVLRKEADIKLQPETTAAKETVLKRFNIIMNEIGDIKHNEPRNNSLRPLINDSVELSRLLRVQKASFSVELPVIEGHQRIMFDPRSMEDISGEDEETLHERELRCVTFPGIFKNGDENGERSHLRNVVAKMKVLCAPD